MPLVLNGSECKESENNYIGPSFAFFPCKISNRIVDDVNDVGSAGGRMYCIMASNFVFLLDQTIKMNEDRRYSLISTRNCRTKSTRPDRALSITDFDVFAHHFPLHFRIEYVSHEVADL